MLLEGRSRLGRLGSLLARFPLSVWFLALLLGGIGVVFIHSTTLGSESFAGQDRKQAVVMLVLPLVLAPLAFLPRSKVLNAAWLAYGAVLLTLVLLPFAGTTINGARRWFVVVPGLTLQPSEFMKPALVLMLAHYLRFRARAGFVEGIGVPLLLTLVPAALMVRQPDLGSALSLLPVLFAMCYAGGAKGRTLFALGVSGVVGFALLFPFLHHYQQDRILVWFNQGRMSPEDRLGPGYHLYQSLVSVGAGGLLGSGLFQGLQNLNDFLPYRSTDFLFAVIAEETGFLGATTVIGIYLGLCLLILRHAAGIRDRFGRLLATGIGVLLATQLFIHAGVCTGLLPTTGLPLALLSYGRSSVTASWLSLALFAHAVVGRQRTVARDMYL
ncbi:MAG: FtsW/RodA/SpoVE family cell cycle protein [Planctomycetota bacterium]